MLEQAQKLVRERPIEAAAAAIGAATLAWVLWPRKKAPMLLLPPRPPPPPPPVAEPTTQAPAPPPGPPRLPGNSARAVEANEFLDRLDAISEGAWDVSTGPYSQSVTGGGPYLVYDTALKSNIDQAPSAWQNFNTLAEAKAHLYRRVLTGRSAFATDNTNGCWRGTCDGGDFFCNMDGTPNTQGTGLRVNSFVAATNGLKEVRLYQTWLYSDGSNETRNVAAQAFQVVLPRAYGPDPAEGDRGSRSTGICVGAPCTAQGRCSWVLQDWEVWGMLNAPPFFQADNAGL
jgi:hypothetical protein